NEVNSSDEITYQLLVVPDLHPAISVNEKRDSLNSKVLYFVGQVSDDHGFTRLNFNYRILNEDGNIEKSAVSQSVPFDKHAIQSNFFHVWNVGEINTAPGQQIE